MYVACMVRSSCARGRQAHTEEQERGGQGAKARETCKRRTPQVPSLRPLSRRSSLTRLRNCRPQTRRVFRACQSGKRSRARRMAGGGGNREEARNRQGTGSHAQDRENLGSVLGVFEFGFNEHGLEIRSRAQPPRACHTAPRLLRLVLQRLLELFHLLLCLVWPTRAGVRVGRTGPPVSECSLVPSGLVKPRRSVPRTHGQGGGQAGEVETLSTAFSRPSFLSSFAATACVLSAFLYARSMDKSGVFVADAAARAADSPSAAAAAPAPPASSAICPSHAPSPSASAGSPCSTRRPVSPSPGVRAHVRRHAYPPRARRSSPRTPQRPPGRASDCRRLSRPSVAAWRGACRRWRAAACAQRPG